MTENNKKQKSSTLSMIGRIILFFLAIFVVFITIDRIAFVLRNHELPAVHSSKEYFIELQIPKSWSVKFGRNKYHWLTAQSKERNKKITIYSFKFNRRISISEFLKFEKKIFPKLGPPIQSEKVKLPWFREFIGTPYKGVDKIYRTGDNDKLLVRYITSSTYAYATVANSASNDLESLKKMLNYDLTVFNKNVIYADVKNILNNYHEIMVWVIGAAVTFTFWVVIGFLGKTGWSIRIARDRIKSLYNIKKEAERSNQILNKKYHKLLFKTRATIYFIIGGWLSFYVIAFYLFGTKILLILFLLVVPALGYFGLRFGPSDDPDDWVH